MMMDHSSSPGAREGSRPARGTTGPGASGVREPATVRRRFDTGVPTRSQSPSVSLARPTASRFSRYATAILMLSWLVALLLLGGCANGMSDGPKASLRRTDRTS
jgi:hypothetical protein